MSVESLLSRGLEIVHRSGSHTKGTLARDANGKEVAPSSPHAVKFDAYGILLHIVRKDRFESGTDEEIASNFLYDAAREMGHISARRCNDDGGKPAVGAMYVRALARAQGASPTREGEAA